MIASQNQGSGMQVQASGLFCIYIALAGPKSAAGLFPQSEEQPIWDQLVCFISVALKLLSTSSYITLVKILSKCVCKHFLINLVMQHTSYSWNIPDFYVLVEFCQIWNFISVSISHMYLLQHCKFSPHNNYRNSLCNVYHCKIYLSPIMFSLFPVMPLLLLFPVKNKKFSCVTMYYTANFYPMKTTETGNYGVPAEKTCTIYGKGL